MLSFRNIFFLIFAGAVFFSAGSHLISPVHNSKTPQTRWVDSVFNKLTPEQRIAQLFMVAAYSNKSLTENANVTELINKYNIGGICFFQGGPYTQARYTNYWQSIAKTPLLIAIDAEWGLGMRLKDSCVSFPYQMTLGAIQDNTLITAMGEEIGKQCRRMGIHINFAPVVDINSNPRNPVINYRSFGQDKENVAQKALCYMQGMQKQGVLATAKHFPGHGDTDKDSHKTLPTINHNRKTIDTLDLYPFKELIKHKLAAVMTGHLSVPALDTSQQWPASLSKKIVNDLLIKELDFDGLIITDALNMKGASGTSTTGQLELNALLAGNDILLMSDDVPLAIEYIKQAIASGKLTQKEIDDKCRKVLTYKYKAGLYKKHKIDLKNLYADLNNENSDMLRLQLHKASVTLLKNTNDFLPLTRLDTLKIAEVNFNASPDNCFKDYVDLYALATHINIDKGFSKNDIPQLISRTDTFNTLIITINQTSNSASKDNYGFTESILSFVSEIKKSKNVIINLLANPYSLMKLTDTSGIKSILTGYQSNNFSQQATAEAIFGGIAITGKLPVTASSFFKVNTGITTEKVRLEYSYPKLAGFSAVKLKKIDSIAQKGITDTVYPGCQILIARNGKVIYHKSFGYHTYENKIPVKNSDLYDLASLTKILATTLSVMRLYEEGKIHLDSSLRNFFPELEKTGKGSITIRQILTHQAGFKGWIPFYKSTIINGQLDSCLYRSEKSDDFPLRVAQNIYLHKSFPDSIFKAIANSELRANNNYLYSDLGFYLLKSIIENISRTSLPEFVKKEFYNSLGLTTLCYQPRKYFDLLRIIPSENDTVFRKQVLHGDVNDQGAAMLDGVGGHAGLFSNSNDIAIVMQMLLQKGEYGRIKYFRPETVELFTSYQYKNNRRGLGFDKPVRDKSSGGPACSEASAESYGHTGFTGTYVWADPKYQLIYVFLSNRTYPYSEKNKLLKSGIRTQIQQIIYQAIEE